jgi:hypothetical protein
MTIITIESGVLEGPTMPEFPTSVVKDEPMFWRASLNFAYKNGGPITQAFLDVYLADGMKYDYQGDVVLFDSRCHMLMPGWYPAIPGYHHDSVQRSRPDGQPNYIDPTTRADHVVALVGEPVSLTEFALGTETFTIPDNSVMYETWHPVVDQMVADDRLQSWLCPMHQLVYFDDRAWHQVSPATERGWRWFGRITHGSPQPVRNEIRRNAQVYLSNPMGGW